MRQLLLLLMSVTVSPLAIAAFISTPGLSTDNAKTKDLKVKTQPMSSPSLHMKEHCHANLQKGLTGNCLLRQGDNHKKPVIELTTENNLLFSHFETALLWKTQAISNAIPKESLADFAHATAAGVVTKARAEEIEFFVSPTATPNMTTAYVGKIVGSHLEKYVLNFHNDNLIYFDQDKTLVPSTHNKRSTVLPNPLKFFSNGIVNVNTLIRNAIVSNSVNRERETLAEANFVTVKQNVIILEKREMNIDNLPEGEYYLREAQKTIKTHENNHASETMDWIHQSRFNHNKN